MADESTFGGDSAMGPGTFGSGLSSDMVGGGATAGPGVASGADVPPEAAPSAPPAPGQSFGSSLRSVLPGPHYNAPDPQMSALDQSADMLQQRIARANAVATNPLLQFFNPEGVQKARDFAPAAAEKLQRIRVQQAGIMAGKQQAATLGLAPGEVPDEATQADRVEVAKARALTGDLKVFKGLQAVDPKAAEAIETQVHETVAGHLTKAQYAFDSLSGMTNPGQYAAKVNELRKDGTLSDLEALGLKVPGSFDQFNAAKGKEAQALREARIGVDSIRQKLEERNTYQPMEEKEAKTYTGRMTTAAGDQITNGTWSRNGAAGTRGLVVNGAADPRDLGKNFTLATPEQRKAIKEEFDGAVSKANIDKYREFNRTYHLATTDGKGNPVPEGKINTNPNVQQGIAEGLASMLRGGGGGATSGLLNIESSKRAFVQTLLDKITANYAGGINALKDGADPSKVMPYLTSLTQGQMRDVMDALKSYNDTDMSGRVSTIANRAGALGLDPAALGLGKGEAAGSISEAMERGRQAQIARMLPGHQAIGGGDGVFQLGAQAPGAGATGAPQGTSPTTQLPGAAPVATPVQQAAGAPPAQPAAPAPPGVAPPGGGAPPAAVLPAPTAGGGQPPPAGGPAPAAPVPQTIAGQPVSVALPPGASPNYLKATQRIESGNEKDPWKAGAGAGPDGKPKTSASGAFQFTNGTWAANKPAGAPDRAGDATPAQQAEGFAKLTQHNADKLTAAGLPVDDVNLYVTHNLGEAGGPRLLKADPGADARTVVGEVAARNNPLFFRGRPTVAVAMERYRTEMAKGGLAAPGEAAGGGATAEKPGLMTRISRMLSQGVAGDGAAKDKAVADVGNAAVEHAPAIGSTIGAIGGSAGGPVGTVAGGAAGGSAGQALKDYLQGNAQDPAKIVKEGALGGVLGVGGAARPVLSAVARATGAGAVEAGAKAVEGGDAADIAEAGVKGTGLAAGGELFGRSLGMIGHKVWNMFAPDAKAAVREAAGKYAAAEEALAKESPKLPGIGGAAGGPNPAYAAAEAAKAKAETVLKDAGLKPEEAAYAHKVSSEGVPKQEAEAARPGALEGQRVGEGYQQLEGEVGAAGKGAVKATVRQSTRLPESSSLNLPRPPTSEELAKNGRVESVPLSEVRATQSTMQWDRFNAGDHPPPIVKGFEDKPVAVRKEDGEYLVFDGHHRTVKAMNAGQQTKDMYVIDAKSYDPAAAGRKPAPSKPGSDDELLAQLGAPAAGPAKPRGGNSYNPVLTDGPMSAVAGKQVSAKHAELAERTEMAITAPAKSWQDKWVQLKDARSQLLTAERDAQSSTSPGRTREAADMRKLADTVRVQQAKAAKYVFGEKDGEAFMERLKVLDVRYRRLVEATNGGDLARAATLKGEAGRDAERKFVAFAHDDPQAIAAYRAMRKGGSNVENDVRTLVGMEKVPYLGHVVTWAKMAGRMREWAQERAAGNPVSFSDLVKTPGFFESNKPVRDLLGTVAQHSAVQ